MSGKVYWSVEDTVKPSRAGWGRGQGELPGEPKLGLEEPQAVLEVRLGHRRRGQGRAAARLGGGAARVDGDERRWGGGEEDLES